VIRSDQLRGSALLLAGTVLSSGIDFGAQVLLVRALAPADFGAWSYALATITLLATFAQLEMRQVVARYLPAYLATGDRRRAVGSVAFALGLVAAIGIGLAAVLVAALGIGFRPTADGTSLGLLAVLAALVPIQAIDGACVGLFAALGASRAIFARQSPLGPVLRLGLVVAIVVGGGSVATLAIGYVVVTGVGAAIFVGALWRLLDRRGIVGDRPRRSDIPAREMLRFAGPLLSSTLVWMLMESSDAILLGYFHDATAVAALRVVLPLARMNQLVSTTFSILYLPQAARLFAAGDRPGLDALYWRTTAWITVLTFPILIGTVAFAGPVTTFLYGPAYAASAPILALLAAGYAFQSVLGFNGLTVKVFGRLRYMVGVDLAVAALNVGLNLALVPALGAIGAAIGTTACLVAHNLLKHAGLARLTTVRPFPAELRPLYAVLLTIGIGAGLIGAVVGAGGAGGPGGGTGGGLGPIVVAAIVAAAGGLAAVVMARRRLEIATLFPEVHRLPLPAWAFAAIGASSAGGVQIEERPDVRRDEPAVAAERRVRGERPGGVAEPVQRHEGLDPR
jgi:O-antigen/teichoic acid export membrane protein